MNIELLNVRIFIQKNEVISDAIGNRKNAWKDYYTCYATVSAEAGKEPPMPVLWSMILRLISLSATVRKLQRSPLLNTGCSLEASYTTSWL